jgi:hypothetical protein
MEWHQQSSTCNKKVKVQTFAGEAFWDSEEIL